MPDELLLRFKKHNYVPDSARDKYKEALVEEYKKFIAGIKKKEDTR